MRMIELLAHAGEVHESPTSSAGHVLGVWYVAIPLISLIFGALLVGVLSMLANDARGDKNSKDKSK